MVNPDTEMNDYYKKRAPVYDRVYGYPERQADLRILEGMVAARFAGLDVLEVAAGTGYWTQYLSRTAKSVFATDATREALEEVNHRKLIHPVEFRVLDAYSLELISSRFSGAFAGLWFSHVPIERRTEWLNSLNSQLDFGAKVMFLDNSRAQCERLPLTYTDDQGNTYQDRQTDSGDVYQVMKNFPTESELIKATSGIGSNHKFTELEHYWYFEFTTS